MNYKELEKLSTTVNGSLSKFIPYGKAIDFFKELEQQKANDIKLVMDMAESILKELEHERQTNKYLVDSFKSATSCNGCELENNTATSLTCFACKRIAVDNYEATK